MKIRSLALITVIFFSTQARAEQLGSLARQVAEEVSASERFLTPGQQGQVARHLEQIRSILNGSQPQPASPYVCTSRDNDGARPFMIGYKDFANVVRIPGTVLGDLQQCEAGLANARRVFNRLFLCGSRDNDGSRPYMVLALNGKESAVKLNNSASQSTEDCNSIVRSMQVRREGVLYCGSRDNDGSRPFVKMGYRFDGTFDKGNESYNSLAECIRAL